MPLFSERRIACVSAAWLLLLAFATSMRSAADDAQSVVGRAGSSGEATATHDRVAFDADVRPILTAHCLACHGGVKQAGGLSLVWRDTALGETDSTDGAIVPGDAEASYLLERVLDPDDDTRMPPPEHGRRLNASEVATLRRWIDQGAEWETLWAFRTPEPVAPPTVRDDAWPRGAIDRFVLARLESEGLTPSPEADRERWLRRVSFDLVGLPPTEADRDAFLTDARLGDGQRGAYERAVDRLLASPHFGERWAAVWLDLARYADTMGYERDPPRDAWPYRDWLVAAFNSDLSYGEFLLKQTAGDLLSDATLGDRLATAMHRMAPTNVEGGTDDEEFRLAAVIDRVDSTWQATQGVTFGCARCHDHPYDPIRQTDYYAFLGLLNRTRDADLVEDWPKLATPTDPARWPEAVALDRRLSETRQALHARFAELTESSVSAWRPLRVIAAESTGSTRLETGTADGVPEVIATGTITDRSRYTLTADAGPRRVTALRLDALPKDPEAAIALPEMGFVLSRLRVFVERATGDEDDEELFFVDGYGDEAEPFMAAAASLSDSQAGWSAYTRMRRPRWAVFTLDGPVDLGEGDRLRVELKHDMSTDGQGALVLKRLRLATSDDPAWTALVNGGLASELRAREAKLVAARAAIPATQTPVLREQPTALARDTFLLDRGAWLAPTDRVEPGTPDALPGTTADRLALGRWLGSPDNPLAGRVWVNRVWRELFGRGLVATLDDFGSTGARPSHPGLLDHLAYAFNAPVSADDPTDAPGRRGRYGFGSRGIGPLGMGQSLKRLLRAITLSATYRQSSRADAESLARDPTNRLLARGPRGRLTAEMIRDQALVLSGRFNPKLGGPPVMPYQPEGVWQTIYNSRRWETADGDDRFRRAIYTYWRRTAPYPSLVAFDAPTRDQCTADRSTTNTPLQALVTLNDPAYVELAEGLAERMLARSVASPRERIAWAAHLATGGELAEEPLGTLVELYEDTLADASADRDADAAERFATTIVAGVLLNLDATLSK